MPFPRIPPSLVPQRNACIEVLDKECASAGGRLYAIVDLARVTDTDHWHSRLTRAESAWNLFHGQPEEAAAKQAPWLVAIGDGGIRQGLYRSVDEALCSDGICWLTSTLDPTELVQRLARRLTAKLPEGEALFRYYDSRLFAPLWQALDVEAKTSFGAIGDHWWYLDADKILQRVVLPGTTPPSSDPWQPPMQCTPAQVEILVGVSERHQLVDFLGKRKPEAFLCMSPGQRLHFVTMHDADAKTRHVIRFADRLRYCELALEHGEHFAEQKTWLPVWQHMSQSNMRLDEAIGRRDNNPTADGAQADSRQVADET